MSLFPKYQDPCDLLHKLYREGRRSWLADKEEDKSDFFFNFCITSLSIRDWCIKHLNLTGAAKNDFYNLHSSNKYLDLCGCIANTSKHFSLDPDRKNSVTNINEVNEKLTPLFTDGTYHSELETTRTSLHIRTTDGFNENLMTVLFQTYDNWLTIFDNHSINKNNAPAAAQMFIEYLTPRQG